MYELNRTIVLYGAGERGNNLANLIQECKEYSNIIIVDGNNKLWGTKGPCNLNVCNPRILEKISDAKIVITVGGMNNLEEIKKKVLTEYNCDKNRIISYEKIIWKLLERKLTLACEIGDNKKRNIIFESYTGLGMGGIQQWVIDVVKGFNRRGEFKVRLLTDDRAYIFPSEIGNCIDRLRRKGTDVGTESKENFTFIASYLLKMLPVTIIVNRPNIVSIAACIIKKFYPDKIKVICVLHSGHYEAYNKYLFFKDYVDLYVAVSKDILMAFLEKGISKNKIVSMTCPFQCSAVLKRNYSIDSYLPLRIGYAGRLDGMKNRQKRMDLVLKLIKELDSKINFFMEIAGEGPAQGKMENFILKYNLQGKVKFIGRLDRCDICDFWKRQDICINLADYEGRSISIIEAMGSGAVPIVTNTSGVNEDIINNENGFIVQVGDYKEVSQKIQYLEKNRKILPVMGKKAHDAVFPKSDIEEHIDFWENILSDIVAER